MRTTSNQWHLDARVPALLDAIRADVPERRYHNIFTKDEFRTFHSPAVDALTEIHEEYGERALRAGDASGDYTAFHTHCSCPSVDQLVSHVLGEMQKFTSQEALVVDAMAAINARRSDAMQRAA